MAFCTKCGKDIPDGAIFCPHCGQKNVLFNDSLDHQGSDETKTRSKADYKDEILDYLNKVYSSECNLRELNNARQLLIKKSEDRPIHDNQREMPEKPKFKSDYYAAPIVIGLLAFFCTYMLNAYNPGDNPDFIALSSCIGIATIAICLWRFLKLFQTKWKARYDYKKECKDTLNYNDLVEIRNSEMDTTFERNRVAYGTQISLISETYNHSAEVLEGLYALNLIYPKYRNIVAISSFCEYLQSGMCEKLTGPNGAYQTFEYMNKLGSIITRLDNISSKLDELQQGQKLLYEAVTRSNELSMTMIGELAATQQLLISANGKLDSIQSYQNSSAELNRITADNTEFLKWMSVFERDERNNW